MDRYPARPSDYEESQRIAYMAAEAARMYLDETGVIDYTRFEPEALAALDAGPGFVTEPAPIDPHHVATSSDEFMLRSNNFYLLFDDTWGAMRREESYYQRFAILFPEFNQALHAQHTAYLQRCVQEGPSAYPIKGDFAESLRTAYGIMAQLIDLNDIYYQETRVRDISPFTRALTA